jgi:hypothetical protein
MTKVNNIKPPSDQGTTDNKTKKSSFPLAGAKATEAHKKDEHTADKKRNTTRRWFQKLTKTRVVVCATRIMRTVAITDIGETRGT